MSVLKSCMIAFSMYSKIPMPKTAWEEKDMRFVMCFFPAVGLVIGGLLCLWYLFCSYAGIGGLPYVLLLAAFPLLISGGIHLDGYMDTMDALHSYQEKDRRLEILKDPHIGAFAVICAILYYLLWLAGAGMVSGWTGIRLIALGFWLSRILSGYAVVTFPCAKRDGTVFRFRSASDQRINQAVLLLQLAACALLMLFRGGWQGLAVLAVNGILFAGYRKMADRKFGGITGDTCGWFSTSSELATVLTAAACSVIISLLHAAG